MATLALRSPLCVRCSPICVLSPPRMGRSRRRFSISMSATSEGEKSGIAIVWSKHDLRVEDHPGLLAAAQYRAVVPIYVFDHRILSRYSDEMLELVLFAVRDLKNSLTALGSDVMIMFGMAEKILLELVKKTTATSIFSEEEVEYRVQMVKETLELDSSAARNLQWRTPFYDILKLKDLPIPEFPPEKLDVDWGQVPTYDYLKCCMNTSPAKLGGSVTSLKVTTPEPLLKEKLFQSVDNIQGSSTSSPSKRKRSGSFFVTKNENVVGGADYCTECFGCISEISGRNCPR